MVRSNSFEDSASCTSTCFLDSQLEHADSDAAWVGLQRIVSLVGDAHTYLQTPQDSVSDLPIDMARFGEDYRIVSVDPGLKDALGAEESCAWPEVERLARLH
jgi:hypothetical protein